MVLRDDVGGVSGVFVWLDMGDCCQREADGGQKGDGKNVFDDR